MQTKRLFLLLAAMGVLSVSARPVMPPLFTDNMVLQQQTDAPIWGQAKAGSKVTVATSWNNATVITTADQQGHWRTTLRTPEAGGPYTITVSDGQKLVLRDVMVGEVWLCSGQSNMEMPIEGWGHVKNFEQEKEEANQYPDIRLLQVRKNTSPQPLADMETNLGGGWQKCSAESVKEFSATGYFFGRDIHKYRNVPVGLIDASWGGTFIEPWTSAEALRLHPDMQEALDYVQTLPADKAERERIYTDRLNQWKQQERSLDPGFQGDRATWALPQTDVSQWPTMNIPVQWERAGLPGYDGVAWLRRTVDIPKSWAGKEVKLSMGGLVDDLDYTYFNGELIGQTNSYGEMRLYTIPARLVKAGQAVVTVRIIDTGGEGGIYSSADQIYLECRGERVTLTGPWHYKATTPLAKMPQMPVNDTSTPNQVTVLYNAMINPLVGFAIRGAIWYQGCNNEHKGYQYRELLPLMIRDWRTKWGYDFPFYIVQLANYKQLQTEPGDDEWAEVREAQAMAAQHVEKSGLACLIDIGDAGDIHPKNKQEVGRRLALIARANTYGEQKLEFSGPVYHRYQIEGNKIRIFFHHADGLRTADGGPLKGFAIAGSDHRWHWADARIEGRSVVVTSPDVTSPVAVRYAWHVNPICNLQNAALLPAVPFRTDDWPGLSINNHRAN
ncbi:MAG: 9-O-acetylesterase [Prevotella sp.]|nr:9-O-acetylesterase [Prevotella sp.]